MTEEKSKQLKKRTSVSKTDHKNAFHYYEADYCKGCGQIYSSILGHWYHVRKSEKCRVYYTREQITLLSKQSKMMKTQAKNDYYQKKLQPLHVLYLIGRSYKATPKCTPDKTLFDAWKDLVGRNIFGLTSSQFACPQHWNDSR